MLVEKGRAGGLETPQRGPGSPASGGEPGARTGLTNGSGASRGRGFTNGGGFTNGSGRTNGSGGRTNCGGRTNGSGGFTNGSGRTNGSSGRITGRRAMALQSVRRTRRRTAASLAIALIVVTSLGAALGFTSPAAGGPRMDGVLGDWSTGLIPAPPGATGSAGLIAFNIQDLGSGPVAAFAFDAPLSDRVDLWVFLDTDLDANTGFFDGSLGADAAVVVRAEAGRALASASMRFQGDDRFDLNSLVVTGPAAAGVHDAVLELELPAFPRAVSVAVAGLDAAASTGAFDPTGQPVSLSLPSAELSGEVRNGILVDGDFSDWAGVPRTDEPTAPGLPGRLDLSSAAAIGDGQTAQFYVCARTGILEGTLPLRAAPIGAPGGAAPAPSVPAPARRTAGTDLLEVYLDTDANAATGGAAYGLGAEHMLRVEGFGGRVVSSEVFTFTADDGWVSSAALAEAAAAGGELEAAVVVPGLVGAEARFVLEGFTGVRDVSAQAHAVGLMSGGALPETGSPDGTGNPTGPGPTVNPIPEISDVLAISAGVFSIVLIQRRRRASAGSARGA